VRVGIRAKIKVRVRVRVRVRVGVKVKVRVSLSDMQQLYITRGVVRKVKWYDRQK
jgi:hypothetical protein